MDPSEGVFRVVDHVIESDEFSLGIRPVKAAGVESSKDIVQK